MWKASGAAWYRPQAMHRWFFSCERLMNKFPVAALQQLGSQVLVVCIPGFLPTMKLQLSQLPLIVGYGRVNN